MGRTPRGLAGPSRPPGVAGEHDGRAVPAPPAGDDGRHRAALERFFTTELFPHLPGDLERTRVSRTVDRFRLVDEATVSFTHDRELPWLLPGLEPTERRAEVLAITIVGFRRGQIASQRILWDHATLTAQLRVPSLR
ncbi:MAG: hypothetical protein ACR2NR_07195 [Solirubrobacteraceae bacterium]